MLIILEGIDCVGKSTITRKLCKYLNQYKKTYYTNMFGGEFASKKKELLVQGNLYVHEKINLIREVRSSWDTHCIQAKNLDKVNMIADRHYLSLVAYQGHEGVIAPLSDVFEPERSIAESLRYSAIMIYIRSIHPGEMIHSPRDKIESRPIIWHKELQMRYDLLVGNSAYSPLNTLIVQVDKDYNYSHSVEDIAKYIMRSEGSLLDKKSSIRLERRIQTNRIYECMRIAKSKKSLKLFPSQGRRQK